MYFEIQNMQDDGKFIISTFKKYMDLVKKHDGKPDNQTEYDLLITDRIAEFGRFQSKLSRMSEKLGGIDKYGDDYLKSGKNRNNLERKYKNLGLKPNQFENLIRTSLDKHSEYELFPSLERK